MAYSDLQADVATWVARTDLTTEIVQFINKAEDRLDRELRTVEMESIDTSVTITSASRYFAFPTDFLEAVSLEINSQPVRTLRYIAPSQMRQHYHTDPDTTTSRPRFYTIRDGFEVNTLSDASYVVSIHMFSKIPRLTDSNTTNWLLDSHSDIYLCAALVEAHLFLGDPQTAMLWEGKYSAAVKALQEADDAKRNISEHQMENDLQGFGRENSGYNVNYD
jgi:hypothetical protein